MERNGIKHIKCGNNKCTGINIAQRLLHTANSDAIAFYNYLHFRVLSSLLFYCAFTVLHGFCVFVVFVDE